MKHAAVLLAFNLSLYLVLPLGVLVMGWWARLIYRRAHGRVENQVRKTGVIAPKHISAVALIYMLPGLFLFILFSIPALYFSNLLQQENYCLEIIRANQITTRDNDFLKEQAGILDIDELLERAKTLPEEP